MTPPETEWVCQYCAAHIHTHIPLTEPPTHWCNGRGHHQHPMQPLKRGSGSDRPTAA